MVCAVRSEINLISLMHKRQSRALPCFTYTRGRAVLRTRGFQGRLSREAIKSAWGPCSAPRTEGDPNVPSHRGVSQITLPDKDQGISDANNRTQACYQ